MFKTLKAFLTVSQLTTVFATPSLAQTSQDFLELKQSLMVLKAELAEVRARSFAVGSVQQSFLPEAEFQRQMGSGWILCDGRSAPGSRWEKLGYGSNVPNCIGRFLRTAGNNAAPLRAIQDQTTAKNGLYATAVTNLTTQIDVSVSGTTADASWTGLYATSVTDSATKSGNNKTGLEAWANTVVGRDGEYWGQMFSHQHVFGGTGQAKGGSWSTTVSLSGDTETRPVNITVNTFVKIN